MKLFRKKYTPEESDIVYEKWSTSFSLLQEHRFAVEKEDSYQSYFEHGNLILKLNRKNLFAWTDDPLYRYENFLLTAEIEIDPANGYSSAGFLFRRIDSSSYYYFLVSDKGHYRLDSVVNGSPEVLIGWTPVGGFKPERFQVSIIADGSIISLFINNEWVGEVSDERLTAGGLSFAAQNYDDEDEAVFRLRKISIESRPVELDKKQRALESAAVTADARFRFAESQIRSGRYPAALIELRKALRITPDNAGLLVMAADCCIRLEMYSEAGQLLDRVPETARDERYLMCRAGMLYLNNDFITLKELLSESEHTVGNSAALNLLGNADFALGHWEAARDAYAGAWKADSGQPVFALNEARACEKAGKNSEAMEAYGAAAKLYFRNGDYDELLGILPFIEQLDGESLEALGIKSKILFSEEKWAEADKIFKKLIKEGSGDSTIYYLRALIESRAGHKRKASGLFKKAIELEPDYYLYYFKKAEFLFLTGGKYRKDLDEALRLAPEEPWVLNLSGQVLLSEGDCDAAAEAFSAAVKLAPEESLILINYTEALYLSGSHDEALALLNGDQPELMNQKGNIYSRLKDFPRALECYEAAFSSFPDDTDIMLNLAAVCVESDLFSRADEILVRIIEREENAAAYNLIGNLASLKGEYGRAEAAYRQALEIDGNFSDAVCNLTELLLSRDRLNDADMVIMTLDEKAAGERGCALKEQVFRKRMRVFNCSSCGREWVVPKKIGEQGALKLVGEPPDDMPAGKCSGCGNIYCIGCAKEKLIDGRFYCASCGEPLKLTEEWMRYLYQVNMLDK